MEKFGLFNVLQTPYSLPDAGSNDGSLGEQLSAALQAAENVASFFRSARGAEETAQTASSYSAPSPASSEAQEGRSPSEPAPSDTERSDTQTTAPGVADGSKTASGEAYARFIQKQETLSRKIGGGK
ncbi:MAG: hypothetical protein ACI4RO_01345 [Candidatus Scatosoma sp.]